MALSPRTQLSTKLGSNNEIYNHDVPAKVRRSQFPLSRKRNFTLDPGALVPIDLIETVPGDSFKISCEYLIKSMPLKVAPFTSFTIRTHWYFCALHDLWKGAETFVSKGMSGNIELQFPTLNRLYLSRVPVESGFDYDDDDEYMGYYYDGPQSLASYFGLRPGHYVSEIGVNLPFESSYRFEPGSEARSGVSSTGSNPLPYGGINVLPFLMYQKIYRMGYVVPNLLSKNEVWFPDDISDGWRINYAQMNYYDGLFHPTKDIRNEPYYFQRFVPSVEDQAVNLLELRYALFESDRFTEALPWATRGRAPKIDIDTTVTIPAETGILNDNRIGVTGPNGFVPLTLMAGKQPDSEANEYYFDHIAQEKSDYDEAYRNVRGFGRVYLGTSQNGGHSAFLSDIGSPYAKFFHTGNSGVNIPGRTASVSGLGFSLNQFRELVALSVWQERNARTQGSYNETIYAHFNVSPKHKDFEPRYLGGTTDIISFEDVIQTSASTTGGTPQGTQTGIASTHAGGDVCYFNTNDYGYIMGIMFIQPETVYTTGVEKLWTRKTMEDLYFPEDEGLGLQEILNREIFVSGNADDNGLFGYTERNTEYKARENRDIGFFALENDRMFTAQSSSRRFSSLPKLSHEFVTMTPNNLNRDFAAVPSYPIFRCSYATRLSAVRPMSYKNIPETFGF